MNPNSTEDRAQGFVAAVFFLFFIQLWTFWVESIYRYSLVNLSPGTEMLSLLFVLAPLLVQFLPDRALHKALPLLIVSVFLVRLSISLAPFPVAFALAGPGCGLALMFCCLLFSGRFGLGGAAYAWAMGLALLASIVLRTWGASVDISMHGAGIAVAGLLALTAGYLLVARGWPTRETSMEAAPHVLEVTVGMVGVFANIAVVYLALSSPAVMSAWTGAHYVVVVFIITGVWALTLLWQPGAPPRGMLLLGNALFFGCIAGTLYGHTPAFPASPGEQLVTEGTSSTLANLPLYAACLVSPVVYLNLRALLHHARAHRPRALALPVFLGGLFMLFVALLLIYTNVWGYVGSLVAALRGKFYLPFLLLGLASLVAVAFAGKRDEHRGKGLHAALATTLCGLVLLALLVKTAGTADATATEKRITVLTYNMQQGSALTGEPNWHAQRDFILATGADIIALQESDTPRPSAGNVDAARYFAEALGYHHYFGPTTVGGTFGTAILSRFPLENPRSFYSYSTIDEVATAVVEVEVAGRRIALFNSHPAGPADVKQAHTDALIGQASAYEHVIAVGDYNYRQDSPWYAQLAGVLNDAWLTLYPDATGPAHPAFPAGAPLDMAERIDHIFVSDSFRVEAAWYVPAPESQTDHPAHWCVLAWE